MLSATCTSKIVSTKARDHFTYTMYGDEPKLAANTITTSCTSDKLQCFCFGFQQCRKVRKLWNRPTWTLVPVNHFCPSDEFGSGKGLTWELFDTQKLKFWRDRGHIPTCHCLVAQNIWPWHSKSSVDCTLSSVYDMSWMIYFHVVSHNYLFDL